MVKKSPGEAVFDPSAPHATFNPEIMLLVDRLLAVAQGDSSQSRICADFLLAWWNAADYGGFDLTALWGLDAELASACVSVFAWLADNNEYPDDLGFGPAFKALQQQWRPDGCPA